LLTSGQGLQSYPPGALLYRLAGVPKPQTHRAPAPSSLAYAESLEIARKDYSGAIRAYRRLIDSADARFRPLGLQRLARTLRKAGCLEESAAAYRDLQHQDPVWIAGLPSDLIAQYELSSLAAQRGDMAELKAHTLEFYQNLVAGRWLLDRPRYLYYSENARSWCQEGQAAQTEFNDLRTIEKRKLALSRAAEDLLTKPARVIVGEGDAYLAFWQADPFAAVILSAGFLGSNWWPDFISILLP
jgi:hypothetical protein